MSCKVQKIGQEHYVVLTLLPYEAEGVADALGPSDGAYQEILDAVSECLEQELEES